MDKHDGRYSKNNRHIVHPTVQDESAPVHVHLFNGGHQSVRDIHSRPIRAGLRTPRPSTNGRARVTISNAVTVEKDGMFRSRTELENRSPMGESGKNARGWEPLPFRARFEFESNRV